MRDGTTTHRAGYSGCPHCGARQNLHTGTTTDGPPRTGDVGVCWSCRGLSIFEVGPLGVTRRLPTPDEDREIRAASRVRQTLAAAAESYDPVTAAQLARGGDGSG